MQPSDVPITYNPGVYRNVQTVIYIWHFVYTAKDNVVYRRTHTDLYIQYTAHKCTHHRYKTQSHQHELKALVITARPRRSGTAFETIP